MRPQGGRLSGAERRAVAEYLSGKALGGDITGAKVGRCDASTTSAPLHESRGISRLERVVAVGHEHAIPVRGRRGTDRGSSAEADAAVGVRISRRDVRVVAADGRRRPVVRRQPERHRLLAGRKERLHRVDVHRKKRRADGARVRTAGRDRPASPSTSATPAPTSTRSMPRPATNSGRAGWTIIRSRASPAHRRSFAVASTCRCRRSKKPRRRSPATPAARSAAASTRSTQKPAPSSGGSSWSLKRSRQERTPPA